MTRQEAKRVLDEARKIYRTTYSPSNITLYQYWGQITRIVDADTFDVNVSVGFNLNFSQRFRLLGVNCPETFGVRRDSEEYKKGLYTLNEIKKLISVRDWVELKVYFGAREKYGRWLCEIIKDGLSVNEYLLLNDLAEPV
jgi:micrococcal nuclease